MAKKNSDTDPLTAVKGVGPARAEKLRKAGIKSPAGIAQYNPDTLAEKTGISEASAKKIVAAAEEVKESKQSTKKKASKKKKASSKKKKASKKDQQKAAKAAAEAMEDIIARARDHFRTAPDEHVFHLRSGHKLRDLKDLAEALDEMQEHVFGHHVNEERHDFANWVHEVLQERALAERLREAKRHPKTHQHVIYRHIVRRVW